MLCFFLFSFDSLNPYNIPMWKVLFPFHLWKKWVSENLNDLSKVTEPDFVLDFIPRAVQPMLSSLHLTALYWHAMSLPVVESQKWYMPTACIAHTPSAQAVWILAPHHTRKKWVLQRNKSLPSQGSEQRWFKPSVLLSPGFQSGIRTGKMFWSGASWNLKQGMLWGKQKRNIPIRVCPV